MAMSNRLVKICLMTMLSLSYVTVSQAQLHSKISLMDKSCLGMPAVTSIKLHDDHAYVGSAYLTDQGLQGTLLKYRTQAGVPVDKNNVPIYRQNIATLGLDLWGVGSVFFQFGTQGKLSHHASDDYFWLTAKQNSNKLIKISRHSFDVLSDHLDDKRSHIAHIIGTDSVPSAIGAVIYPPSIHSDLDLVIYGDTLGVLRMVDAVTGRQIMAYIPRRTLGARWGVDAHWSLHQIRNNGQLRLIAIGGFGRSGKGVLALDVTDVAKGGAPAVLYEIAPNADFHKLSHVHAPISLGHVKWAGQTRAVFVFGGGVDECYENSIQNCQKDAADGSAIYAIDALTGQKVFDWQDVSLSNRHIRHSFGGELTLVDRQRDGIFDHVYAADLGGQIFRFDVADSDNQMLVKAVRVFRADDDALSLFDKNHTHFYQKPIVSTYLSRHHSSYAGNGRFALINIASNDENVVNGKQNHVYGIFDEGLIFGKPKPTLTKSQLAFIDDKHVPSKKSRDGGWYHKLQINGDDAVTIMGGGVVVPASKSLMRQGVRGVYQLSVVKPNDCLSKTISQPQTYCLPFGVCSRPTIIHADRNDDTNDASKQGGQIVLTLPTIQGIWMADMMTTMTDGVLSWQALRPNDEQSQDGDLNNHSAIVDGQMLRTFRPTRWYDVRSIGDNY